MPVALDVDRFEHIAATAELALLRISGRWRADEATHLPAPELVVGDGDHELRLSPLPSPDDAAPHAGPEAPPWRAAFSAPAAIVASDAATFVLRAGDVAVALAAPAAAHHRAIRVPDVPPLAPVRDQAERRAHERRQAVRELESRLETERGARVAAEQRAEREARARERLERAPAEVTAPDEARVSELERDLLVALAAREEAEGEARRAGEEAERLRSALAERPAEPAAPEDDRAGELERELLVAIAERETAEQEARRARHELELVRQAPVDAGLTERLSQLEGDLLEAISAREVAEEEARHAREELEARGAQDAPGEPASPDTRAQLDVPAELERARAERDEAVLRADDMERRAAEAAQRVQALYTELSQLQPRVARAEQLEERLAAVQRDRARVEGLETQLERALTERDDAVADAGAAREQLAAEAQARAAAGDELEAMRAAPEPDRFVELEEAYEEAQSRADRIAVQREEALVRLNQLESRRSRLEDALGALRERLDAAEVRAAREAAARTTLATHLSELAVDGDAVRRAQEAAARAEEAAGEEAERAQATARAADGEERERWLADDEQQAAERMAAMRTEAERRAEARRSGGASVETFPASPSGTGDRDAAQRGRAERLLGIALLVIGLVAAGLLTAGIVNLLTS